MLIVEGPDGAGKSTLVKKLAVDLDLKVGERATKDRNKLYTVTRQDTYTALAREVQGNKKPRIWDRLFFSEMVYAPLVGRDCEFSPQEQTFVKGILTTIGCPIIICRPPLDVVDANVRDAEQMEGVKENIHGIYTAYGAVAEGMPWVLWYDYTEGIAGRHPLGGFKSYDEILSSCQHYLNNRKARSW
jgi:hypothetical protein